jgi:hypothetical protein
MSKIKKIVLDKVAYTAFYVLELNRSFIDEDQIICRIGNAKENI